MMQVIEVPVENVIGFKINGNISTEEMHAALESIKAKFTDHEVVNIYSEVEHFEGVSFGAIVENIKFALPNIKKFKKEAVISDEDTMKKWVAIGDKLWFGGEAKYFSFAEKDKAIEWLR